MKKNDQLLESFNEQQLKKENFKSIKGGTPGGGFCTRTTYRTDPWGNIVSFSDSDQELTD